MGKEKSDRSYFKKLKEIFKKLKDMDGGISRQTEVEVKVFWNSGSPDYVQRKLTIAKVEKEKEKALCQDPVRVGSYHKHFSNARYLDSKGNNLEPSRIAFKENRRVIRKFSDAVATVVRKKRVEKTAQQFGHGLMVKAGVCKRRMRRLAEAERRR